LLLSAVSFIYIVAAVYNPDIRNKTFLAINGSESVRVIKGNDYRKEIKNSCHLFKIPGKIIKEMEVIQECASIKDWNEIDIIWPATEIVDNTNKLLIDYYFSLILAATSLICGIQAIKCYRNDPS
jgi:hypothetical protein